MKNPICMRRPAAAFRLASTLLAAASLLAGCAQLTQWIDLKDHPDAPVIGTYESYKPPVSDSGRQVTLSLAPDYRATLAVSYVWKRDPSMLKGAWKRDQDALEVTLEGLPEQAVSLRFEVKDDVLKNTDWNAGAFGGQGLGELRRK